MEEYRKEIEEIYPSLQQSCRGYAIRRGKTIDDADDAMHTALHRLCSKIETEGYPIEITFEKAAFGFFKFVWLEKFSSNSVSKRNDEEPPELEDESMEESIYASIIENDFSEKVIEKSGKGCHQLLIDFYVNEKKLDEISKEMGLSKEALRVKKSRCLTALRKDLLKYLEPKLSDLCNKVLESQYVKKESLEQLAKLLGVDVKMAKIKRRDCMVNLRNLLYNL